MQIHPLSPARVADYLAFFDHRAFSDNPQWQSCYCNCLFADEAGKPWAAYSAEENRAAVAERIAQGVMHGFLAYTDGGVVGWLGAGPKESFPVFAHEPPGDRDGIGALTCFLVAPAARGQGIARALLRAALAGFRASGLSLAEAYPRPRALTAAALHYGPMSLFVAEGFALHAEEPDGSVIVRRAL
jgi:GNAT superfamily N-acetyltransferase